VKALVEFGRRYSMQGCPVVVLYDSVVTMCPLEERHLWTRAHTLYMYKANSWRCGSRILNYPIDNKFTWVWGGRTSDDDRRLLNDMAWHPVPDNLKHVERHLDAQIKLMEDNPELGVYNAPQL
jgi:hypothetical protein